MPRIPRPYRFSLLLVAGMALFFGWDHPPAAAFLVGVAAVVVGLGNGIERVARARSRARREGMPYGTGVWRGRVGTFELAKLGDFPIARSLLFDAARYDVYVRPDALLLEPTGGGRRVGRFPRLELGWDEILSVSAGPPVHELGGKPVFIGLTPVTFVLVGDKVGWIYREVTDEEAADEDMSPIERAEEDAEALELGREEFGEGFVLGTMPFTLLFPDSEGLVETAQRYVRGVAP